MFTRVVEVTAKSGKSHEVSNIIHEKSLPILRQQAGFLDLMVLTSDSDPDRIMAISQWRSKEDAERYHRDQYARISDMFSSLLQEGPHVRTFHVHTSTSHKIAAGKAA